MSGEVYYSVDIEADGPYPGDYSMSSFGIVACGHQTREGVFTKLDVDEDINNRYYELQPISGDFDPDAAAVAGLDRDELVAHGWAPADAMSLVNMWVRFRTHEIEPDARAVFVGYPLGFDWLFFYWYLMKYARTSPFGHSSAVDMKTMYMTKANVLQRRVGKRSMPNHLKSNRAHTHNALDDAKEQGELFQNLMLWDGTS